MLQPARLQDLEMYATASAGKHNLVSRLEATPIDYKAEDFLERVRALSDDGVDAVFDPVGGAHAARSFGTLRSGGRPAGRVRALLGASRAASALWPSPQRPSAG